MDSRELRHILKGYKCDDLVLKVVGREEYMLKEKRISSYKVLTNCVMSASLFLRSNGYVSVAFSSVWVRMYSSKMFSSTYMSCL